ncbi:tetratricopeptide repeat protein [Streptomyces sp. NPDC051569]|uniref:tetratricopeptide repeat protein n=1 Tax=Streptomyces sp. NPDC051569 TaxID=3365661 RepID=UPI0037A8F53C
MNAMKTEQVRQVRRAALAAGVGAVLVAGVLLFVPDKEQGPSAPGPEARAMAAADAGAPAALADLTALIRDRERWLRTHPEDGQSWAALGSAYVERGARQADSAYYPKAGRALRRSLALPVAAGARGNPDALVGLASLANARHDFAAAKKWGEEARALRPAGWTAYPVLIDAYSGLGDYAAAGKALDRLKELRSGSAVLELAAQVYRDRGWREDAAAKAAEAVARAGSPAEKAEALRMSGDLAWERGEPQEALGQYGAALTAVRDHPGALAGRARALAAVGRTDEALSAYQLALEKLPELAYLLELGELYDSLGLDGDARTQYAALRDRAALAREHGVDEEVVLARFEADHDEARTAVERLRAQWRRGHRNMWVADALGWALYRAGEGKEALTYAKKATDQGLRSALFSYHRGEIERSLEMYGQARRHLEEALRTNPVFSPLLAPRAREARDTLGEPAEGGPEDMYGDEEPARSGTDTGADAGADTGSGATAVPSAKPAPTPKPKLTSTPKPTPTPSASAVTA